MDDDLKRLSRIARSAAQSNDWSTVNACARQILQRRDQNSAEGAAEAHFLLGLVDKAARRTSSAIAAFSKTIHLDATRYDAAVELAWQYAMAQQYSVARDLLDQYRGHLANSPLYLDLAARTYSRLGLHADAWPLHLQADALQPNVEVIRSNLAACAVRVGEIERAKGVYTELLRHNPAHQRHHYELSRLQRASDSSHLDQMLEVLRHSDLPPQRNIFLYYAIGKELEDLERWSEAFHYYQLAGNAAAVQANYDVNTDIELIDQIVETCDERWLSTRMSAAASERGSTPIFVVGLPRTGTTLTERIIASHSQVESADETFFMPASIRRATGIDPTSAIDAGTIVNAANADTRQIAQWYLQTIDYRLAGKPMFIDKLPENILYLGFIASAFPNARLVKLTRNPLDACFALYKQSFFRFAYSLDDLARYYVAHNRLCEHWRKLLGERLIEVEYESLVTDQENQTRVLLEKLGLEFEQRCLDFEQNQAASSTASAAQVREKIHQRSIGSWRHFSAQLASLINHLHKAGISTV